MDWKINTEDYLTDEKFTKAMRDAKEKWCEIFKKYVKVDIKRFSFKISFFYANYHLYHWFLISNINFR